MKPKGRVKINNGAASTRKLDVTLNLSATDPVPASGMSKMRFSHNGRSWTNWQTYDAKKTWTLKKGVAGGRTVFAQFRDRAGNSSTVKDTIKYRS